MRTFHKGRLHANHQGGIRGGIQAGLAELQQIDMNPLLIVAIVSGTMSFGAAWTVQGWRYDAKESQRLKDQQELAKLDRAKAQVASEGFEHDKSKNTVEFRTITKTVEKIVDRPVYLAQCFDDDGMRELRAAVRATGGASEPKSAVPAAE